MSHPIEKKNIQSGQKNELKKVDYAFSPIF